MRVLFGYFGRNDISKSNPKGMARPEGFSVDFLPELLLRPIPRPCPSGWEIFFPFGEKHSGVFLVFKVIKIAQTALSGGRSLQARGSRERRANMDQFIRTQNVERYRRVLERVTEELADRQFSIYLPKSNKSKKTRAIQFKFKCFQHDADLLLGRMVTTGGYCGYPGPFSPRCPVCACLLWRRRWQSLLG